MERAASKLCEVVLDLTQFGPQNEIPNQWISQLLQLLPFDVYDNVASIHIYNPNSFLRKYIKKLPRPVTHKISKRISFAVTLVELQEHIHASEIHLPKSTSKSYLHLVIVIDSYPVCYSEFGDGAKCGFLPRESSFSIQGPGAGDCQGRRRIYPSDDGAQAGADVQCQRGDQ